MIEKRTSPNCAKCNTKSCDSKDARTADLPVFCPMKTATKTIQNVVNSVNTDADLKKFYLASAWVEKNAYETVRGKITPVWPRAREVIEFAKRLDVKKLGVAFCIGLSDEAKRVVEIFEEHGFEVYSVVCKCGGVDKTRFGVLPSEKIDNSNDFEAACNPLLQAELLHQAGTGLNVTVGLCVGHDSLFFMHSKTPTTALIVKDRVTGHNPLVSLYSQYHKNTL